MSERLTHFDENGKAIIERFTIYTIPHLDKLSFSRDWITDFNNFFHFFSAHACVNEIVFRLSYFITLLRSHYMNGL